MGFPYGNVRSGQAEGRNAPGPGVYCWHCPVLQDLARILEKRLLTVPLKRRSASSRQLRSMSRIKNDLRIHQSLGKENGLHHIGAHARADFITIVSEYDSSSRTAHYHLPLSPPGSTWRSPADVAAARQPRSSPHSY